MCFSSAAYMYGDGGSRWIGSASMWFLAVGSGRVSGSGSWGWARVARSLWISFWVVAGAGAGVQWVSLDHTSSHRLSGLWGEQRYLERAGSTRLVPLPFVCLDVHPVSHVQVLSFWNGGVIWNRLCSFLWWLVEMERTNVFQCFSSSPPLQSDNLCVSVCITVVVGQRLAGDVDQMFYHTHVKLIPQWNRKTQSACLWSDTKEKLEITIKGDDSLWLGSTNRLRALIGSMLYSLWLGSTNRLRALIGSIQSMVGLHQ